MSEVALNQVSQEELMRLTGMSSEQGGSGSKNKRTIVLGETS